MKHIKPFNELHSSTYYRAARTMPGTNLSTRRRQSNMVNFGSKRLKEEQDSFRSEFIDKYKKYGIFKFDIYTSSNMEMDCYLSLNIEINRDGRFYDISVISYITPVSDEDYETLSEIYTNTSITNNNGLFRISNLAIRIDFENENFVSSIGVYGRSNTNKQYLDADAYDRATSNRIKRLISKLFEDGSDYETTSGKLANDILLDKLMIDNSSKYGIELRHIKEYVDEIHPTTFMHI